MMDKQLAGFLQLLVNTPESWDRLTAYAEYRINTLKDRLTTEKDYNRILGIQEAIMEQKRFLSLRDEVNAIANPEKRK